MPTLVNPLPCTESSLAAGEPIMASATAGVDTWLMIEMGGKWEPKAWEGAPVPDAVRRHVDGALPERARLQLIRRGDTRSRRVRVIVASSLPGAPLPWGISLGGLEDLLELDLSGALAGHRPPGARELESLFLVCTHGRRDRCCALHGGALFKALSSLDPRSVWQTSHLGGHRFAATAAVFPGGHLYGRLRAQHAEPLLDSHRTGRLLDLAFLRGRSCWSAAGQAAEHLVREATGELAIDAVRIRACEPAGEDGWRVVAETPGGEQTIDLVERLGDDALHGSCAKDALSRPTFFTPSI